MLGDNFPFPRLPVIIFTLYLFLARNSLNVKDSLTKWTVCFSFSDEFALWYSKYSACMINGLYKFTVVASRLCAFQHKMCVWPICQMFCSLTHRNEWHVASKYRQNGEKNNLNNKTRSFYLSSMRYIWRVW